MEHIEKITDNLLIKIDYDEHPMNCRIDWDNLGTMICFHRNYILGDEHNYEPHDYNSWEEMKEAIIEQENVHTILPLYLCDHSGITISTSPFSCRWDSGQVGWIFVSKDKVKKEGIDESKVEEYLEGEVKDYDKYLTGEIYYYKLYKVETCDLGHEHEELLDSCHGYYDFEQCLDEAKSIAQTYINKFKKVG